MSKPLNFFERLFSPVAGRAQVTFTDLREHVRYPAGTAPDPEALDGRTAYFSVVAQRLGDITKRGRESDAAWATCAWLDVDLEPSSVDPAVAPDERRVHRAAGLGNLPPSLDAAVEAMEAAGAWPSPPTIVVDSGWGAHLYWVLDDPVDLSDPAARAAFAAGVEGLQRRSAAALAARGWRLDVLSDLARILRAPGSTNLKVPGLPRPVRVLLDDGPTLSLTGLTGASAVSVPPPAPAPAPRPDLIAALRDTLERSDRDVARRLARGESLAEPGERDAAMNAAAGVVAFSCPDDVRPEEVAGIFSPVADLWAAEVGAPLDAAGELAKWSEKLSRAFGRAAAARAAERAGNASIDEWLRERDRVKASQQPLIVQSRTAFWVRSGGEYGRPLAASELEAGLRRQLAGVDDVLYVADRKGGRRLATVQEILRHHAVVASTLTTSLAAQRSAYDHATGSFTEAACPIRPIEPRRDDEVDAWLRALGGAAADRLLDWVATITRLDACSCALYLSGPRGLGKTLLAKGLSRLWTTSGPAELDRVLDTFNEDLARCPLVLADEHIPEGARGRRSSADLRRLVGSRTRTLNRKFLPQAPLDGAVRLIVAANNDRLLSFRGEELGQMDIDAIAERFLYVDVSGVGDFFSRFDGARAPSSWVDGDAIPAHALWLRDNRPVTPAGRFLVAGSMSKVVELLALGSPGAIACEAVVRWLGMSPSGRAEVRGVAIVGGGEVLASASGIHDHWERLLPAARRPQSVKAVGQFFSGISRGVRRVAGTRYHSLKVEYVLACAEELGADVDAVRAAIGAPLAPVRKDG